jgi:hypothetical protein
VGFVIQIGSWLLWFPLMVLVLTAVLRAGVRRYPVILAYLTISFLVNAAQVPFAYTYTRGNRTAGDWYQTVKAVADGATYLLLFCVVVTFLYKLSAPLPARRIIRTLTLTAGFLLVVVSFLAHSRTPAVLGVWMSYWIRDVYFGAAVLDLVAWGMLVAARDRDNRLLLLTGGLGIMFAGEAVAAALRSIAIPIRSIALFYSGHILGMLANAAFLYTWWQTFRAEVRAREQPLGRGKGSGL